VSFPLGDWIDARAGARHSLAQSGMVGQLRTLPQALQNRPAADETALRGEIGRLHDTDSDRVFLTHGATEGDFLALSFLGQRARREHSRAPRIRISTPEYPQLLDGALAVGYRRMARALPADVLALSDPNNPEGCGRTRAEVGEIAAGCRRVVIDETFREFTGRPSHASPAEPGWWVVGSFTKIFGADAHRVGFVIPAAEDAGAFDRFHGVAADGLAAASVTAARAILGSRKVILDEGRRIFRRNLSVLRRTVRGVGDREAPLWFDRDLPDLGGDRMAEGACRRGVLVCPGSFFGDPNGVRICLTKRCFPEDLSAYLTVREQLRADRPRNRTRAPRRGPTH